MPTSKKVKKIISIIALGFTSLCMFAATCFFVAMGWQFGYEDLDCREFTETQKFADELMNILAALDSDASVKSWHDIPTKKMDMQYVAYNDSLYVTREQYVSPEQFLEDGGYQYSTSDYGIVDLEANEDLDFHADWYSISMSAKQIDDCNSFAVMSKEDYIALAMAYTSPNDLSVNGLSEAEMKEQLSLSIELQTDGGAEATTSEEEAGIDSTAAVAGSYIDSEFAANSYIGYRGDDIFVYSPGDDMFYSSQYGWYTVPDQLYFNADDFFDLGDIDVLFQPFACRASILEQKVGMDYLSYMSAKMNLEYEQRNIVYYMSNSKAVYTNVRSLDDLKNCKEYLEIRPTDSGEYTVKCVNFTNSYLTDAFVTKHMQWMEELKPGKVLYVGMYITYPYTDTFWKWNRIFENWYPYTIPALVIAILFAISSIILLVHILRTAGRGEKGDPQVYLNFVDKCPIELMPLLIIGSFFVLLRSSDVYLGQMFYGGSPDIAMMAGIYVICYVVTITALLSMVRRGKAKTFLSQSLVRWISHGIRKLVAAIGRQRNLQARVVELFVLYWVSMVILSGLVLVVGNKWIFLLNIILVIALNIWVLVLLLKQAKGEQAIRNITQSLANGELEIPYPKKKPMSTEQEIIDNITHLNEGLQKAVEKSIHDEKMKAELITNVSHDIKTPLTSIINYVDLIKRENVENENVRHYIEVLDRKSWRLKQLTEDLVEISKISTGNIELERVPIDFGELLRQSLGEFEDKFREHELQMVENIPEHAHMIFADGRRTYRILENLLQNVYKYAMPGTRVYIDLEHEEQQIRLSIKNISQAPLNISADELMERFVRGDQSRTTEGSGLGLSIAQDLVQLQDGEFHLYLDGDLFKVVILFREYIGDAVIDMEAENLLTDGSDQKQIENDKNEKTE